MTERKGALTREERKDERLSLRVDAQTKALLRRAAELSGSKLTEFLLRSAIEQAEELISRTTTTRVSPEAFCRALDLIEHPPEPTPALVEALRDAP